MCLRLGMVLAGLILLVGTSSRADEQADAMKIIDKAIQASGGAELLAKNKAQTWKEKGTYYGMGNGLPYTGTVAVDLPGKMRMDVEGVFTIVLNGDEGWIKSGGMTKPMTKDQLAEEKEELHAGWETTLLPLKSKEYQLSVLGDSKVDNQAVVGVKVTSKGHRDVKLYFDKKTGLLAKGEWTVKADEQGGKEVNQESLYQNYKDISGLKIPTKIVIKRDGKLFVESDVSDFKSSAKLDPKEFAKPQ